jgi:F-type H+-transporting ATPase subunit c
MKKLALISSLIIAANSFAAETAATEPVVHSGVFGHGSDVFGIAFAVVMSSIAIGLIGYGAATAIGRNPSAAADIKSATLLPMVFAEGLGIVAVVLAFVVAFVK